MLFHHDFLISTILAERSNHSQKCDFEWTCSRFSFTYSHRDTLSIHVTSLSAYILSLMIYSWNIKSFICNILGTIKSSTFLSLCFEEPIWRLLQSCTGSKYVLLLFMRASFMIELCKYKNSSHCDLSVSCRRNFNF